MTALSSLISKDLGLEQRFVDKTINTAKSHYKNYTIPKRNGGRRAVSQPSPELKVLQYWVVNRFIKRLPVSECSFAYTKGNSIKKHALMHVDSKFIFHADIEDFFPTISPNMLKVVFEHNVDLFTDIDVLSFYKDISKICFKDDGLCIGAVSSPSISNAIMKDFDDCLNDFAKREGYIYTRYADDIYISSKDYIPNDVKDFVEKELSTRGFCLNKSKTHFYSPKNRRVITGLVITNDSKISIGYKNLCRIKKMVYEKIKLGKGDSRVILGYLSFLRDVDPHAYDRIIITYSKFCIDDILAVIRGDSNNTTTNSSIDNIINDFLKGKL